MASLSEVDHELSLEEFLQRPEIDQKPYLEFVDGRIEVKVSPRTLHSVLRSRLLDALNRAARPARLGEAFPELRCTFAGRSIVPDVVFLLDEHIRVDARGRYEDVISTPPDLQIEILSPDQSPKKTREKLEHSVANGCPLGWFLDPEDETVDVYRPGLHVERLPADGFLDAAPVLPGFRVSVSDVFGWLTYRQPIEGAPGADPA